MDILTTTMPDAPGGPGQSKRAIAIIDDNPADLAAITGYFRSLKFRARGFPGLRPLLESLDWSPDLDCIIASVRLDGVMGACLVNELRSAGIIAPIVLLARHIDMALAMRALEAGANEVVEKPFQLPELAAAVQTTLARGTANRISRSEFRHARASLDRLTDRQREIIDLVANGLTSKEIGLRLGISYRTVEAHRLRITERLGAHSLQDMIRMKVMADLEPGSNANGPAMQSRRNE